MAPANLSLVLSNGPEDVATVHAALSGLAAALGLDALSTEDLHTAAGEACKNVMHHAYEGHEGPLEVEALVLPGELEVVVRDHGMGIRPLVGERTLPHTGIGMPIVHSLSRRITYINLDGGGTEVRMLLDTPGAALLASPAGSSSPRAPGAQREPTAALALAPAELAGAVLPRVLVALATRAGFSGARLADVQLLARLLAAAAGDEPLTATADVASGVLTVRIGPLAPGATTGLLSSGDAAADAAIGAVIADQRTEQEGSTEMLVLRLTGSD